MSGISLAEGRFRLVELVSRGPGGEAWRAEDQVLGRLVLVTLPAEAGDDDEQRARSVAGLVHPNLDTVLEVGVEGDRVFVVTEPAGAPSLRAALAGGVLPPGEVAAIGVQVARALTVAHATGLVHGGLTPGRLLLHGDGTVTLTGLGLAAAVPAEADYLSPEHAIGRPAGPADDVYALGCVLCELLTGRPPFTPAQLSPEASPALDQAILSMLATNPADRPAAVQAEALLEPLAVLGGRPSGEETVNTTLIMPPDAEAGQTPGPGRRQTPRPARRPSAPAVAVAVLVVAAVAVVLATVLTSGDSAPPPRAVPTAEPTGSAPVQRSRRPSPNPARTAKATASAPASATPTVTRLSPAGLLAALLRRLDQQVATGQLDQDTANKVRDHLRKIADKHREGKTEDASGKINEILLKLREAQQKGTWTSDSELISLLDQLDSAL